MGRITSFDIAKVAGVSRTTVSRILNGTCSYKNKYKDETVTKVLETAENLGYTINRHAQGLAKSRSYNIGFAIRDFSYLHGDATWASIIAGIGIETCKRNYNISLCLTHPDKAYENGFFVNKLNDGTLDGVIIKDEFLEPEVKEFLSSQSRNCVLLNSYIPGTQVPNVSSDDYGGMCDLIKYVYDLGHREIVYIAESVTLNWPAHVDRVKAYKDTIKKYGCCEPFDIYLPEGWPALMDIITWPNKPTCIVCSSSYIAKEVITFLMKYKIRVPGDISVAGFEKHPSQADFNPTITGSNLRYEEVGTEAAKMLISMLEDSEYIAKPITIPTILVPGRSTRKINIKNK